MTAAKQPAGASSGKAVESLLSRVTGHYDSVGAQSMEIPEWGDDDGPLTVYWTPLTMGDSDRLVDRSEGRSSFWRCVDALIMKAQDGQGNALFTIKDRKALMERADRNVLLKLGGAILSGANLSAEDAEKN